MVQVGSSATGLNDSLRRRSPFSITAILFVGQRIKDAGKGASELQTRLREHAENIGASSAPLG